jgi:hypothetical protein
MNRNIHLAFFIIACILFSFSSKAQNPINWSTDTVSKTDALAARSNYLNVIRGSGQKATERINLPVDKLKAIMDACAANNIYEVSVMIVTIRQQDIARYKKSHPESTATDEQLKGSQILVFRIPRRAFQGAMGAKANIMNNAAMISMLGMGLVVLDKPFGKAGSSDDLYLSLGTVCPPPLSCD